MIFKGKDDRRAEPRRALNTPGVVVAPGLEMGCALLDESRGGLRIRLQRDVPLPDAVVVVDIAEGLARQGRVMWRKGHEAGLKISETARVGGLVPERLTAARDAWRRAGGR
jgi:hypothetical protein